MHQAIQLCETVSLISDDMHVRRSIVMGGSLPPRQCESRPVTGDTTARPHRRPNRSR